MNSTMDPVAANDMALDLAMANSSGANKPVLPSPQTSALGEPPDIKDPNEAGADSLAQPLDMGKLIAQHQMLAGQVNNGNPRAWAENAVAGVQAALAGFGAGGKVPPGAGALYGVGAAARQAQEARAKASAQKTEQQQRQQQIDIEKQRATQEGVNANRDYDLRTQENARQQAESVRAMQEHDARMTQLSDDHTLKNLEILHADVTWRREQADIEDTLRRNGGKHLMIGGKEAPTFDDLGKAEDFATTNDLGKNAHLNGYRSRPVLGGDNKYHIYEVPDDAPEFRTVKDADGKPTQVFVDSTGLANIQEKFAQAREANARAGLTYEQAKRERDDYKEQGTVKEARKELDKVGGDPTKLSAGSKDALRTGAEKDFQLNWNVYQGAQRDLEKELQNSSVPLDAKGDPDVNSKEYKELEEKYQVPEAREQLFSAQDLLRKLGYGYKTPCQETPPPGTVGNPKPPTGAQAADFLKGPPKPKTPGEPLDEATAKQYMEHAGGDKAKARELAKADGWGLGQ